MRKNLTATLIALPMLAGCVETAGQLPDLIPVGADGQEQTCAAAFAERLGTPMASIRVNGRDTSPSGNTVVFLQSVDLAARANCEVNDFGTVLSLVTTN